MHTLYRFLFPTLTDYNENLKSHYIVVKKVLEILYVTPIFQIFEISGHLSVVFVNLGVISSVFIISSFLLHYLWFSWF